MGFAGQHEGCLRIATVEFQVWCTNWWQAGRGIALDIEPVIFALEEQWPIGSGRLDTVDLRIGDVCDGAGRYQLRRIDAKLNLRFADHGCQWLPHTFGGSPSAAAPGRLGLHISGGTRSSRVIRTLP